MKYFGHMFTAPMYLDAEEVPCPVNAECIHCLEQFEPGDDGIMTDDGAPFHRACFIRMVNGPVAHIQRRCSCYIPGSNEHDPPGMTRRQAAQAAFDAMNEILDRAERREAPFTESVMRAAQGCKRPPLRCSPCNDEIGPGLKYLAVTHDESGLRLRVYCEHSTEPPPDGATLLASLGCAMFWLEEWFIKNLTRCKHGTVN